MSETMEILEIPQSESTHFIPGARYAIDPIAFFFALVCAPLLVALMFFWVIGIPVFALVFGGLPYLIFGTPALLVYLYYRQGSPVGAAYSAVLVVIVGCVLLLGWAQLTGEHPDAQGVVIFGLLSVIHAAAWGFAFGKLYNRWRSDVSRQPLPPFPNENLTGPVQC